MNELAMLRAIEAAAMLNGEPGSVKPYENLIVGHLHAYYDGFPRAKNIGLA